LTISLNYSKIRLDLLLGFVDMIHIKRALQLILLAPLAATVVGTVLNTSGIGNTINQSVISEAGSTGSPNFLRPDYITVTSAAVVTSLPQTVVMMTDKNCQGIHKIALILSLIAGGGSWLILISSLVLLRLTLESNQKATLE
jgi:hypothetical protein